MPDERSGRSMATVSRDGHGGRHRRVMARAVCAAGLALCAVACSDAVAPHWSTVAPFAGEHYELTAIDGRPLPTTFVFYEDTFVVATGSVEFASGDTVTWTLDMTPRAAGGPPTTVVEADAYQQPSRDSIEVGALDLGAFTVSPWAYGRRRADSLTVHTADPVASNPHVQPGFGFFGVHVWQFARSR